MARLDAERRLKEAENSLARLEGAVHSQGTPGRDSEEMKEEMIADVRTLKSKYLLKDGLTKCKYKFKLCVQFYCLCSHCLRKPLLIQPGSY